MHQSWKQALRDEFQQDYFKSLIAFVEGERKRYTVYPPPGEIFTALKLTPLDETKVVIVGQDPYHGPGQAHGLSFSVRKGVPLPASLINIYKELVQDVGFKPPGHGCLQQWAERGVLLLNSTLTVREHEPGSHRDNGWETFTDAVLAALRARPVVFVLWGAAAREKVRVMNPVCHVPISSAHPSPRSAYSGFFGSRPFSKVNEALEGLGLQPVDWQLTA